MMRVVKAKTIWMYAAKHPDSRGPLAEWLASAKKAEWNSIQDVRSNYPHADAVTVASGRITIIFNIKGNTYRLIVAIHFNRGLVFVLQFLTHAQYSKGMWKDQL
jgi:mRNA interferase HigB